jgi:hypothetical protein
MLRFAFILLLGTGGGAAELTLEWQTRIGPVGRGLYTAAVCPDGAYYFSDGRGGITVVGPQGEILARGPGTDYFQGTRLVACDDAGRLYLSGSPGSGLAVLRPDGYGEFRPVRRVDAPVSVNHLAFGPGGRMFAAGFRPRSLLPLHAIAPEGTVLYSFGEPESGFVLPRRPPDGFVFWLPESARVVFVPRMENELLVYDERGRLIERLRAPGSGGHIRPVQGYFGAPGEVTGAAAVADGIAVQARGKVQFWSAALTPDDDAPSLPGLLSGADADGGLYFTSFGAPGITVRKAHKKKPGRQRFLANRASGVPVD